MKKKRFCPRADTFGLIPLGPHFRVETFLRPRLTNYIYRALGLSFALSKGSPHLSQALDMLVLVYEKDVDDLGMILGKCKPAFNAKRQKRG